MIVVTTPTGTIGRQLVQTLLGAGERVRVIARDPDRLAPDVRARVETVAGSHGDAGVVDRAFDGAEAVFWLVPPDPAAESLEAAYLDFTRPACAAIVRHAVPRVVGVSALGRGTPLEDRAGLVTAALRMDDLIAATGVAYRALAMPSFMDNMLRQVPSIRAEGVIRSTLDADLALPTCATRDIAAVAARWLTDRSWTGRAEVPVLGPEDLSMADMAATVSDVLGLPVRFQQAEPDALRQRQIAAGMSPAYVEGYLDMMAAKNAGLDQAAERTPETSTPTTFRQWCEVELRPAVAA